MGEGEEAVRAEQALVWGEKYCQQNSLMADTSMGRGVGGVARMQNSSHPCHERVRFRMLMGYLKRRYKLNGKGDVGSSK